jgi:CubicO group peptidase (beta-lactamase class C family)
MRQQVLAPLGMRDSTFLRSEVPAHLATSPHVGMPLSVPQGVYPYTRRHAPSSSLHSNLVELCRWIIAHLESPTVSAAVAHRPRLEAGLLQLMWQPVVEVGRSPWEEAAALGWAVGTYRGHRMVSHSGMDPGFGSKLVLVPSRRTGVVVLANSNTVPTSTIAKAALDVAFADEPDRVAGAVSEGEGEGLAALRAMLPPIVGSVATTLRASGRDRAKAMFDRLAALEPAQFDVDDEVFTDAVWGAIELHRTTMVWPILRLWTGLRPDSSAAWTMIGWAHQVDGQLDAARDALSRALAVDPENEEAAQLMASLGPA